MTSKEALKELFKGCIGGEALYDKILEDLNKLEEYTKALKIINSGLTCFDQCLNGQWQKMEVVMDKKDKSKLIDVLWSIK